MSAAARKRRTLSWTLPECEPSEFTDHELWRAHWRLRHVERRAGWAWCRVAEESVRRAVRWAFPAVQAIRLHLLPDDSDALGHAFFPASAVMDAAGRCISDGMTTTDVFNAVYEPAGGCDWDRALSEVLIERFSGERFAGLGDRLLDLDTFDVADEPRSWQP